MSRSMRNSRFSFRSRAHSSRSAVVSPRDRPLLRAVVARSIQVRNAATVRSRSRATRVTVLPSSNTRRTTPALNSSVTCCRARRAFLPGPMIAIRSAFRKVSTKAAKLTIVSILEKSGRTDVGMSRIWESGWSCPGPAWPRAVSRLIALGTVPRILPGSNPGLPGACLILWRHGP